MRAIALLSAFLLAGPGWAQPDSSLTREFAGMSAKERNRIAKQEQEDARNDPRFIAVMAEADAHFQAQRYEEALGKYAEARRLRPLNVFPKVRIQDLQALLAKHAAEQREPEAAPQHEPEVPSPTSIPVEEKHPLPANAAEPVEAPVREIPPAPPSATAPLPKPSPVPRALEKKAMPVKSEAEPPLADGVQERSFIEGRAVVLERVVAKDGLTVAYRKVTHPWGQVIHFRDGQAISEREWIEAFPER